MSLLLIIVTTGYIRIMLNEQRQSTDFDQSAKAFYSAEAGVEDAVNKINNELETNGSLASLSLGSDCSSFMLPNPSSTLYDLENQIEVTCQRVDDDYPATAKGRLSPGQSAHIELENADVFSEVFIAWSTDNLNTTGSYSYETNPDLSSWTMPPALRIATVSYPTGSFAASELHNSRFTLWPSASASGGEGIGVLPASPPTRSRNINATCSEVNKARQNDAKLSGYTCLARISDFDAVNRRYSLHLKSFNSSAATDYEIAVLDNSGNRVSVNQDIVLIDVTARAGDVFRRVEATYNPSEGLNRNSFGYDYVMWGDQQICKALRVDVEPDGDIVRKSGGGNDTTC